MGRVVLTALASAMFLGACSVETFDEIAIANAEQAVRAQLKDPSSATFEGEFVVRGPLSKDGVMNLATCGYVNARNGFGGMAGRTRFVVSQVASQFQGKLSFGSNAGATIESDLPTGVNYGEEGGPHVTGFEAIFWDQQCKPSTSGADKKATS